MKRTIITISLLAAAALMYGGCKSNQTTSPTAMTQTENPNAQSGTSYQPAMMGGEDQSGRIENGTASMALAPIIIYKTRGDYKNLVPITLTPDKQHVVARPAPSDLLIGDGLSTPIELADGYLLDRRGVGPTSAFVSYTYEQYFAIKGIPSEHDLLNRIVDADPFTEMYRCDRSRCNPHDVSSMNAYIKSGKPGAVRLKK